jgi:hypothetical protein
MWEEKNGFLGSAGKGRWWIRVLTGQDGEQALSEALGSRAGERSGGICRERRRRPARGEKN